MTVTGINISSRIGALLLAAVTFCVMAGGAHFVVTTERDRLAQNERVRVQQRLTTLVSRIDAELNANVFLANGLVAYISALGDKYGERMDAALKAVHHFGRHLRNVGVAPGNRIAYVYPREGNEAAIGLYFPDIPAQWPVVKRAIDERTTIVAGPLQLKQGGTGLISRTPVFLEDGSYWGILSLVLDIDTFFDAVGMATENDGIRYAMRGKDGEGAAGEVFFGDASLFDTDSVQISLTIPGGRWVAAAIPSDGWQFGRSYFVIAESAGILSSLLLAIGVYAFQRNRTQTVESEKRLRAFLETTREGVIVVDQRGVIAEFNAAAEKLFGYRSEDIAGSVAERLLPQLNTVRDDFNGDEDQDGDFHVMPGVHRLKGVRHDGSEFPTEVSVGLAEIGRRRFHVVLVRDITLRMAHENKLIELATTDGLTHVLNRRAFLEAAGDAFRLQRRYKRPLSLMMIDADHFKRINDNYGHHVGDDVLVLLAEVCREFLRGTDKLARFGGEEFIALLPESNLTQAADVAGRLLDTIRAAAVHTDEGDVVRFTVSIGLAEVSDTDKDIEDAVRRADAAMYEAKGQGRDRFAIASTPE